MIIADTSFYAKISDPMIGGTYMTLLNTIRNLGGSLIQTFFLWLVDVISWRRCIFDESLLSNSTLTLPLENKCIDKIEKEMCAKSGGRCFTDIDGYYIEVCFNVIYGVIWFYFGRKLIMHLQNLPAKEWYILNKKSEENPSAIPLNTVQN